jgi:3-methyladenine DNA glycosylase Mpg
MDWLDNVLAPLLVDEMKRLVEATLVQAGSPGGSAEDAKKKRPPPPREPRLTDGQQRHVKVLTAELERLDEGLVKPQPNARSSASGPRGYWMTETEAAKKLDVDPSTMRHWRCRKKGPPWCKVVGGIRYDSYEIEQYLESRHHEPLSGRAARGDGHGPKAR